LDKQNQEHVRKHEEAIDALHEREKAYKNDEADFSDLTLQFNQYFEDYREIYAGNADELTALSTLDDELKKERLAINQRLDQEKACLAKEKKRLRDKEYK